MHACWRDRKVSRQPFFEVWKWSTSDTPGAVARICVDSKERYALDVFVLAPRPIPIVADLGPRCRSAKPFQRPRRRFQQRADESAKRSHPGKGRVVERQRL